MIFLLSKLIFLYSFGKETSLSEVQRPLDQGGAPQYNYQYAVKQPLELDAKKLGLCMASLVAKFKNYSLSKDQMKCAKLAVPYEDPRYKNEPTPSLLNYLSRGPRDCDLSTGQEERLKEWILKQPNNSINPLMLFEKSLELNQGNIWNALITNYQLLGNNARYYNVPRQSYNSTFQDASLFFNKFIDIRGDLATSGLPMSHGDHPGTWYRIWGAMLWRADNLEHEGDLMTGTCPLKGETTAEKAHRILHSMTTVGTFFMDEKILKGWRENDSYKYTVDILSSSVFEWMTLGLKDQSLLLSNEINNSTCDSSQYLKPRK